MCEYAAMVLCTGRTPSDVPARTSFKARINTLPSRLDGVLVDCGLFGAIQSCGIGGARQDSDHLPLEVQLQVESWAPLASPLQPQAHIPTFIWDRALQGHYVTALQSGPCQTLMQQTTALATAGSLEQADSQFSSLIATAAQAAGFPSTKLKASQPKPTPRLSAYPWFNSRCAVLKCQLLRAASVAPHSPQVKLLGRQCQTQLRHSRAHYNQHQALEFSQLLKSNLHKFWQAARLPHSNLSQELQLPAAWDAYLTTLTAAPAPFAIQLPPAHTPQPPTPAISLNSPISLAEMEVGLQQLHNGRAGALQGYTSELLRYAKLVATPDDPAPAHLAGQQVTGRVNSVTIAADTTHSA